MADMKPSVGASYLDQHLPEEGHDEGRVHAAQPSYSADGQLSDFKHFVVQSHKQSLQILGLGQVRIKTLIKRRKNTVSNVWICRRIRTESSSGFLPSCHISKQNVAHQK